MKKSLLIPVHDDASRIPSLLASLAAMVKKTKDLEILFVSSGSADGAPAMLEAARLPGSRLIEEKRSGYAGPLNRGVAEAKGELLLFLSADSLAHPQWANAMERALAESDLVVGETGSAPTKKPTPYAKVAAKLFAGHSERTAHASGHALPWGSASNLGATRALVEKVGPFSSEAAGAFDIDWCWRAMLAGARIRHCAQAKTQRARARERRELLEQFENYGLGEAWLHRTYAFLLAPEDRNPDPLLAAVDGFRRLRHESDAARLKTLAPALDEVAAAFAAGVRVGYERPPRDCPLERVAPAIAISWATGPKGAAVFVPGKGVANLEGKPLKLWRALEKGDSDAQLAALFMRLFKTNRHRALHEVADFRASLRP